MYLFYLVFLYKNKEWKESIYIRLKKLKTIEDLIMENLHKLKP